MRPCYNCFEKEDLWTDSAVLNDAWNFSFLNVVWSVAWGWEECFLIHHDTSVCFKPDKITKLTLCGLCKQINLDLSRALYCATDTALLIILIIILLLQFVKFIWWQINLSYPVLLLGILPLLGVRRGWLSPTETGQSRLVAWSLSTGICFGGGVILTSCLTHMLPDVNEVGANKY